MNKDVSDSARPLAPHLVIEPSTGWRSLRLHDIWEFRDLLFALGMRDVRLVYKQTFLGITWVILQPLIGATIFAFVFGLLAQMPSSQLPYFVFAFAGMLGWTLFSTVLNASSTIMLGSSHLVSKIYFPRLILPISSSLQPLVNFAVGLLVMIALMFAYGIKPGILLLALPFAVASLLALALGIGFWSSSLMVRYRDLRFIIPVVVQFLLYASPVGYSLKAIRERVPENYQTIYMLNPLASLLELFRASLLSEGAFQLNWLAYSIAFSGFVLVSGAYAFRRAEREFADLM